MIKSVSVDLKMSKKKIYKAGTTVWLWCRTHDGQSQDKQEYTLETDHTEAELNECAEEFFWSCKEPEWGFSDEEPENEF